MFDATDYEKRVRAAAADLAKLMTDEFGAVMARGAQRFSPNTIDGWFFPDIKKLDLLRRQFALLGVDIDAALRTRDPAWIRQVLDDGRERIEKLNISIGGLLGSLESIGQGLPASLREYIDGLERAGVLTQENIDLLGRLAGDGEADWRKIQEAVERYGGDISKLGGTFQAQRLSESWQQLIDDMALFEAGGIAANDILALTKGKIIEVVNESRRFGTEIPENMRPWIQALIESGELVDENGEKITDIGKLKFGETLQTTLALLTDEIKRLILTLGGVPAAAATAARGIENELGRVRIPPITIDIEYNDPGYEGRSPNPSLQEFGKGGLVRRLTGSGGMDSVLARVTPGEFVLTPSAVDMIGVDALRAFNEGRSVSLPAASSTASSASSESSRIINVNVDATNSVFDSRDRVDQVAKSVARAIERGGDVLDAWARHAVPHLVPGGA